LQKNQIYDINMHYRKWWCYNLRERTPEKPKDMETPPDCRTSLLFYCFWQFKR